MWTIIINLKANNFTLIQGMQQKIKGMIEFDGPSASDPAKELENLAISDRNEFASSLPCEDSDKGK